MTQFMCSQPCHVTARKRIVSRFNPLGFEYFPVTRALSSFERMLFWHSALLKESKTVVRCGIALYLVPEDLDEQKLLV